MLFKFCGTVSRWKYPGAPCRPRWCPGVAAGVLAAWPFGRDAEGLATAAQRREAGARRTKCRWFPAKKWEQCSKAVRSIQWLGYLRIFGIQSSYSFFPISLLHWYQELADFQQLCNRRFEDCLHNLEVA